MKWLDIIANKLAEMFACPVTFRKNETPAVTPPAGVTFSEEEFLSLQNELDVIYAKYDELLKVSVELRHIGKFKKADQKVLDKFDNLTSN